MTEEFHIRKELKTVIPRIYHPGQEFAEMSIIARLIDMSGELSGAEENSNLGVNSNVQDWRAEFINWRNEAIVKLGYLAVGLGDITKNNVSQQLHDTVMRHSDLMEDSKFTLEHRYSKHGKKVCIAQTGTTVINRDAHVVMRNEFTLPDHGLSFMDVVHLKGVDGAIRHFTNAQSVSIAVYDPQRINYGVPVQTMYLEPSVFSSTDPGFRSEWADSFSPFKKIEAKSGIQNTNMPNTTSEITSHELVVAAGLLMRYNLVLDLVQDKIKRPVLIVI